MTSLRPSGFLLLCFLSASTFSFAQPTLPDVAAATKDGINILSWINPYTGGVTSVSIQRSADSTFNFGTIGLVKSIDKAEQTFIDPHPLLGDNWYRVSILFSSGTDWISNVVKLTLDSNDILNQKAVIPDSEAALAVIQEQQQNTPPDKPAAPVSRSKKPHDDTPAIPTYTRSPYVFTDPFSGNINIVLPEALEKDYSLYFYNTSGKEVLAIPRVNDTEVILDKRNFESTGLFRFQLFQENEKFAQGYITVY